MNLEKLEEGVSETKKITDELAHLDFVDVYVEMFLELEGESYELAHFNINFGQEVDYKNQPQQETRGGQITIELSQSPSHAIYDWAKRGNKCKDGVVIFKTKTSGNVMDVVFENAYCTYLERVIDAHRGTTTILVIAPEYVKIGGTTHDNRWRTSK